MTRDRRSVAGRTPATRWSGSGRRPSGAACRCRGAAAAHYRQISRLGNPLVNEVIIPLGQKDRFNRTTPDRDAELYGKYVVEPELAQGPERAVRRRRSGANRTDIVQAVLQGIPGLNAFPGPGGEIPTDTININLGTPPSANPDRLGVHRRRQRGLPERAPAHRRRGRHRPAGRRRGAEGEQRPARRRGGPEQPPVPGRSSPMSRTRSPGPTRTPGFGSQLKTSGRGAAPRDRCWSPDEGGRADRWPSGPARRIGGRRTAVSPAALAADRGRRRGAAGDRRDCRPQPEGRRPLNRASRRGPLRRPPPGALTEERSMTLTLQQTSAQARGRWRWPSSRCSRSAGDRRLGAPARRRRRTRPSRSRLDATTDEQIAALRARIAQDPG